MAWDNFITKLLADVISNHVQPVIGPLLPKWSNHLRGNYEYMGIPLQLWFYLKQIYPMNTFMLQGISI